MADKQISKPHKKEAQKRKKKQKKVTKSEKHDIVQKAGDGRSLSTNERFMLGMYPILPDEEKTRDQSLGPIKWGFRSHIKHPLSENELKSIYMMASRGIKTSDIYAVLGFDKHTWGKMLADIPRVRAMLDRGRVMGKQEIASTFHKMATDGQNPNVTIQAMKMRVAPEENDKMTLAVEVGGQDLSGSISGEGTPDNPEVLEEEPKVQPFKITIVQSKGSEEHEEQKI